MSGSPWGSGGNDRPSGNGGGGGNRPPNIDDLANQFQDSLKKMFPGKKSWLRSDCMYLTMKRMLYDRI